MLKKLFPFFDVRRMLPTSMRGQSAEIPAGREMYKQYIGIAVPSVCEMVLISLISMVDTVMVSSLGTVAVAAVGLVNQPRMIMLCLFFALNVGITAVVARRKGENRREEANAALRTAIVMILGMSAVLMALLLPLSGALMRFAGAEEGRTLGLSTLFKMILGKEQPDAGSINIGQTVQISAVDQMRDSLPNDKTAWEAISDGQDILQVGKFSMPSRAYLGRFNFKGGDQQKIVGTLSGGERGRLHLAKTLLAGGNVLLLDEPSNDLDVETLRALEDALLEFAGCALVTSHDRWFLDRIATHILAFEGDSKVVFFGGNYTEYEADKRRRLGDEAAKPHRIRFKPIKR